MVKGLISKLNMYVLNDTNYVIINILKSSDFFRIHDSYVFCIPSLSEYADNSNSDLIGVEIELN